MPPRKTKPIDYQSLPSSELVWLAQAESDAKADTELLTRKEEVIRRLIRNCVRKYTFVDPDDLYQSLVIAFFKVIRAYRPGRATDWDKYCYHRLTFCIKDILRQRDDLGICWPQKKHYPEWFHLYDQSGTGDSGNVYANSISDHRHLSEEAIEELEWRAWHAELQQSLLASRCHPNPKPVNASLHDTPPVAWSQLETIAPGGRYYWQQISTDNRKRKRVSLTLLQWRRERTKPKQMRMW